MTNQEMFDTAVRGLAAQGFTRSVNGDLCRYRGDDGKKCALGHCLTDDQAKFVGEGGIAEGVIKRLGLNWDRQFAGRLQMAHDGAYTYTIDGHVDKPDGMRDNLRDLARAYNLTIPSELQ